MFVQLLTLDLENPCACQLVLYVVKPRLCIRESPESASSPHQSALFWRNGWMPFLLLNRSKSLKAPKNEWKLSKTPQQQPKQYQNLHRTITKLPKRNTKNTKTPPKNAQKNYQKIQKTSKLSLNNKNYPKLHLNSFPSLSFSLDNSLRLQHLRGPPSVEVDGPRVLTPREHAKSRSKKCSKKLKLMLKTLLKLKTTLSILKKYKIVGLLYKKTFTYIFV